MEENKGISFQKTKNYKIHLIVFVLAVVIFIILSWFLPVILNTRENIIEKYLMVGFAIFLIFFLFWLEK